MQETLYEAIGGVEVLRRLSDTFYNAVLADPMLAPVFVNFTPHHRDHVADWLSEVFGGPETFTTEHGGHRTLIMAHFGLAITEEQRTRWMRLMNEAVERELPANDLLRQRVMEYLDWGTQIAKDVSAEPAGTDPGEPGPTPRWGWNENPQ